MILSSESEVIMVGLPSVPLFFRGLPKEIRNKDLFVRVLQNSGLDLSRAFDLPSSKLSRYQSNMSDLEVWNLFSRRSTVQMGGIFARLIPVLPFTSEMIGDVCRTIDFLAKRLPTIDSHPLSAKQVLFLETADEYHLLCNTCPIHAHSDVYLRRTRIGLLYAVPLYVSEKEGGEHDLAPDSSRVPRARSVQGALKAFLQRTNTQLCLIHPALTAG